MASSIFDSFTGALGKGDIGGAVSAFGSAAADLFNAGGGKAAETQYSDAAAEARQEASYAVSGAALEVAQQRRQAYQTISTGQADVGANGLAESGSALDIMRSSESQAALQQAATTSQGAIQAAGYEEQSNSLLSQAKAASAAASGGIFGAALSGVAGLAKLAPMIPGL